MNILQVVHSFPPESWAGTEVYSFYLSKELLKRNNVSIFYRVDGPQGRNYQLKRENFKGLEIYKITNNTRLSSPVEGYLNKNVEGPFKEVLLRTKPKVVHFQHLLHLSTSLIKIANDFGARVVLTLHDYWYLCWRVQLISASDRVCSGPSIERCLGCVIKRGFKIIPQVLIDTIVRIASARNSSNSSNGSNGSNGSNRLSIEAQSSRLKAHSPMLKGIIPQRIKEKSRFITQRQDYIRSLLEMVDILISPSEFLRHTYIKWGVPGERIILSRYGINKTPLKEIGKQSRNGSNSSNGLNGLTSAQCPVPSAQIRFGYIGTIAKHKGIHILLEAFQGIKGGVLMVYGDSQENGAYQRGLRKFKGNVVFCGGFPNWDLREVLSGLDVLVVPSIWPENSPIVIHEAMASGIPVIASNIGGIPELIAHGKGGLLFDHGDARGLRRCIKRCVNDRGLLNSLRMGIGQVRSIEDSALEMEEIYKGQLDG